MALARFGIRPDSEAIYTQIATELGVPPGRDRERLLTPDEAKVLANLMEARKPIGQITP